MSTFKKVQFIELVGEGFKGYKERTVLVLEEGKNTFIGDNGVGKSSIGELIVWVVTGRNILGKQKDLNIINKDCSTAMGSISFYDENGNVHVVERKVSSTTTLKFDQKRISQKELDEMISTELFLLIFNPLYFLAMDMDSSRNTVYSLLPGVEKEDILAELTPDEKAFLEGEHFKIQDTNDYLKNRRKELVEIEDNKKYVQGYMAKLEEKFEIPSAVLFDSKAMVDAERQLESLNERKPVLRNLSDLLMKKSEFDKEIAEMRGKRFESEKVKLELQNQKNFIEHQIKMEMVKEYKEMDSSKLKTDFAVIRNDYKSVLGQNNALDYEVKLLDDKQIHFQQGEECPSCKQMITEQAVKVLNGELQKQVSEGKTIIHKKQDGFKMTLAELEKEGKLLSESITKAKNEDDQNRKKFEEQKQAVIVTLQTQLKEVNEKLGNLSKLEQEFMANKQSMIQVVLKNIEGLQLNKLEKENFDSQKSFDEQLKKERFALQTTINQFRKEKDSILQSETRRLALVKRADENVKELEKKKVEVASYEKKEAHINFQISYMKVFNTQKITIMNRTLSKHLNDVSLKLEKTIQSTGEIKDCFEVLYNGKELKVCSTSETIKAGLEMSHMIRELSGLDYPIFVDNGESITSYDGKASQTIETQVVKDSKLSVWKDGIATAISTTPTEESMSTDDESVA